MPAHALVNQMVDALEADKDPFLDYVRGNVRGFIEKQGAGCLALVETTPKGRVLWKLSPDPSYIARLISFCRGVPHGGNALESALTEPVVGIVTDCFEEFYESRSDVLAEAMMGHLMSERAFAEALAAALVGTTSLATDAVRNKAAALLADHLREAVRGASAKGLGASSAKAIGAALSKPIAAKVAMILVKAFGAQLKVLIAKMIASGALKALIAATVKKYVLMAVAGVVVKAVATKFGISASAAFAFVLIPVIAAYIAYEVTVFPKTLGEKVSAKVAEELSGTFTGLNREVIGGVAGKVVDTSATVLADSLLTASGVREALGEFVAEAMG